MYLRRPRSTFVLALPLLAALFTAGAVAQVSPSSVQGGDRRAGPLDGMPTVSEDADPALRRFERPAREVRLAPLVTAARGRRAGSRATSYGEQPAPLDVLDAEFLFTGVPPEGDTPSRIAFTSDGSKIVIAHRDSANLIVFDAATRVVLDAIDLSGSPQDLALSSDGVHAVTANVFEDTASIVNLVTGLETGVVAVGRQPGVVRITPDGATAIVGNTVDSDLSVIDIASAAEVRRIPNAEFVASVTFAFEPGVVTASFSAFELANDTTIVHPDYYNARVQLFDIPSGTATTLATDLYPRAVALTPDGSTAVVTHTSSIRRLTVIDVPGGAIAKTVPMPVDCWGPLCVRPDGVKAVVAVQNACRFVDLVTDTVSADINTASVYGLLTTADGNYAQCVGYYGSLIDFGTGALLKHLNAIVSCPLGAVSPVDPRAALVANSFGEDMVVVNTNGGAGFTEGVVPSGPPPEVDRTRTAAVSADGSVIVAVGILGDTASILDATTGQVRAVVDVGDRPAEVAITPDGGLAVVANLDSYFTSIIDLSTYAVTNVSHGRRGSQVEISPDGRYAYVCVVADGDGVYRIDLDTRTLDGAKILTGNMSGIWFWFYQTSGMTLSHDGATLVVCGSYDDKVSIIDTGSWSLAKTMTVGDSPVRATFAHDDSEFYVTGSYDDAVHVVSNAGAASVVTDTIAVGDNPFEMALSPDGTTLYVINFNDDDIGVVDLGTSTMNSTIPISESAAGLHLDRAGRYLYAPSGVYSVSIGPGPVFTINMEGYVDVIDTALGSVVHTLHTGLPPAMLAFDPGDRIGVIPSPPGDGVTVLRPHFLPPVGR